MNKQLLLCSLSALTLSSILYADVDEFYSDWNTNETVAYDECCCNTGKLLVDAQFLWWSPGNYDPFVQNVFVNTVSPVASPDAPLPSQVNTSSAPFIRISEKWSPGVRVGLGWESSEGHWGILGHWTGYSNYARRVITSTPPSNALSPDNFGYVLPVNPILATAIIAEGDVLPSAAVATYKLNYNVIDLVFANNFQVGPELQLSPYAGLRTAFIHQRQSVSIEGAEAVGVINGDPASLSLPTNSNFSEKLWSIGPRIGCGLVWGKWYGVSLIGNVSGSLLYGRVKEPEEDNLTRTIREAGRGADVLVAILPTNDLTHDRYSVFVPNAQIQLGFNYQPEFLREFLPFNSSLNLYAMVEGNYYGNASTVFLRERGLGLYGLTLGFAFNW